MSANDIPTAFVWTKIEAEAGQIIDRIIHRKELEGQSGALSGGALASPKNRR